MKKSDLKNCTVRVSKPRSLEYPVIINDENGKFLAGIHIPNSANTTKKFKEALAAAIKAAT